MTAIVQESRFEFAPPEPPGRWPALLLAVAAHALLMLALTFSVQWRHQTETPAIAAELWSKLPEVAAPRLEEPPTPIPEIKPVEPLVPVTPAPPSPAPPKPNVAPTPPLPTAADIALEREKQKKIAEDHRRAELLLLQKKEQKIAKEKAEKAKLERELAEREKQEKEKLAKAQRDKLAKLEQEKLDKLQQKKEADRKAEEKQKKAQKEQEDKARLAAAEAKAKSATEAKALEVQRQRNLNRMAGLAGASGDASSTGAATRSAGPSASYTGRIIARVKPNIVFADDISGNPVAEVEVRTAPDGTIVGRKLVKSSGNKAWDDAVLKALDKTEILPKDEGRPPPSPMVIAFRPRD